MDSALLSQSKDEKTLEFRLNGEIPIQHYGVLAAILNEPWEWLIKADSGIIKERLSKSSPIIAAYDIKKPDEKIIGVDLSGYTLVPVVLLETILLKTDGDYDKIPRTYAELTNKGGWIDAPSNVDTVMFVDITAIPSRRGSNGQGEVKEVIDFVKALFDPSIFKHIWTYSPDVGGIIRQHNKKYGAEDTLYTIKDARDPIKNGLHNLKKEEFGHNPALNHVRIMSYRG